MTAQTTARELESNRSHRLAFVIVFEGIGLALTTSDDLEGVKAAWAGTEWEATAATWFPSAFLPGAWSQQITFFNPKIRADSISFRVLDRGDYLAGIVFGNDAQSARTFLTSDLANDTTSIHVQETGGFTAPGYSYISIGNETIRVHDTDMHSGGWFDCDRAQWALHRTDGGDPFAPPHRLNRINGAAPRVTTKVNSFVNRKVAIYLHHFEPGSGTWSSAAQATLVWEGMLRNANDNGDRSITFSAVHATDMINCHLLTDQFTADLAEGVFIDERDTRVVMSEDIELGHDYAFTTNFGPGWWTARGLLAWLSEQMVPAISGLTFAWSADIDPQGMVRFQAQGMPNSLAVGYSARSTFRIGLGGHAWTLLGVPWGDSNATYSHEATGTYAWYMGDLSASGYSSPAWVGSVAYAVGTFRSANGNVYKAIVAGTASGTAPSHTVGTAADGTVTWLYIQPAGMQRYERVADKPPIKYSLTPSASGHGVGGVLRLANVQGQWDIQPSLAAGAESVPPGVEGYVQFGNLEILGVSYDAVAKAFTVKQILPTQFSANGGAGARGTLADYRVYRDSDPAATLKAKQIWFEKAPIGEIMARLLLSTGVPGYNHALWDVNPVGMCAGVPASLLDIPSLLALGTDFWTLLLTGPTELTRLLESALATYNRYLVWRQGKLTLVEPRVDGPAIAVAYHLTNDNKTRPDDRVRAEYATDGVINRVEIKFDRDTGGTFRSTEIVDDVVSQSDFGLQRAVSVEAWGIESLSGAGLPEAGSRLAGKVLAFFSRPMTVVERTISKQLVQIVPGDTVLLTDPYLINPKTGTRGLTNWPAWVVSASFDPSTMSGKARLAYSGEFPTEKMCPWAWTALVNYASTNGGYTEVDGSNRYLEVLSSFFQIVGSNGPYPADDTGVVAGDEIMIRERSPVDAYAPLIWHRTVASVDLVNHRIYLTAVIADWDPDRQYYVTPEDILTIDHAQLVNTFIADDETDTTGFNPNDPYIWGNMRLGTARGGATKAIFVKPPLDGSSAEAGQPLCVGDVADAFLSLNNLLAFHTRHLVWTQVWTHDAATTTTSHRELVAGPVWVPLYGYGARSILLRLYCQTASGGNPAVYTVTSSKSMPEGTTGGPVIFTDPQTASVAVSQYNTTLGWTAELLLFAYPEAGREPPGVWLSIECQTGSDVVAGTLRGVSAFEEQG